MNTTKTNPALRLSGTALHIFGLVCLLAGAAGTLIQRYLGVGDIANTQLLEVLGASDGMMQLATVALICQILEICAVPVFAFLLAEGAIHTAHFGRYFLRVLAVAVVCQVIRLPAGLGAEPAFGLVMSLVMLYFFRRFQEKKAGHIVLKILAILGTFLWSNMLGIDHGGVCVILTAVAWGLREKPWFRAFGGCMAAICCTVFSPLYMAAPLAFLVIYFYGGQRGNGSPIVRYLSYPAIVLVTAVAALGL